MTALPWLGAVEIGRRYQARTLSPPELVAGLLAQIDRHEPAIGAFTSLDREAVLAAARAAEGEMAAGRDRGPLHGVPVAVKDIIDVAGERTSCHSRLRLDHRATRDATVVARLRDAGALIFGKLATHEFAIGGPSFDLPFPPARNPWDPTRHPGGSSSGSGAGLAAGFFPLALGTDTGGSIRHPAGACGIVGLKPTYGLVSRDGVFPVAWSLDTVGPMARSAADAMLLLEAMTGTAREALDPAALTGLRVGFVRGFHERDAVADPEVSRALDEAARTLAAAGANVTDIDLRPLADFATTNRIILTAEAWAVHAATLRTRARDYCESSRRRLLVGAFLGAGDLVQAQRRRGILAQAVTASFREVDLLLVANSMDPPCRIDDAEALAQNYGRQARTPFNLTGHPALALPIGFSREGLPLSCQFVGPHGQDRRVLAAGAAYEAITGWGTRHPPGLGG